MTPADLRSLLLRGAFLTALLALQSPPPPPAPTPAGPTAELAVTARFAPGDGPERLIVEHVAAAKCTVRIQAYSFTSRPIAAALIAARVRGVDVRVILDATTNVRNPYSRAADCARAGIAVSLDDEHPIAHNKVLVIDNAYVITGSWNCSAQANHNAENVAGIASEPVARAYLSNWDEHAAHATPYAVPMPK